MNSILEFLRTDTFFNNNTSNICIINNFVNIKSSEINKNKE